LAKHLLLAFVALSLLVGVADAYLYYRGAGSEIGMSLAWAVLLSTLVAMWIEADSRRYRAVYRPFEFGFLLFLVWPVYLPYYLLRTRRALGLLWLAGFLVLYSFGLLLSVAIYLGG